MHKQLSPTCQTAIVVLSLSFLLQPLPVWGTKPCPPNPCLESDGRFNLTRCRSAADWIATGRIVDIEDKRAGHPENKNFASFTFVPESFEKGAPKRHRYRFTVGWCHNQKEPKERKGETFTFFGVDPKDENDPPRYLHFIESSVIAAPHLSPSPSKKDEN